MPAFFAAPVPASQYFAAMKTAMPIPRATKNDITPCPSVRASFGSAGMEFGRRIDITST